MAIESPLITASVVTATEFPDLARRYRVTGVPKTVAAQGEGKMNELLGAMPEDVFVAQALEGMTGPPATPASGSV